MNCLTIYGILSNGLEGTMGSTHCRQAGRALSCSKREALQAWCHAIEASLTLLLR